MAIHHIDAVVNAITHINVKPPRLTEERFVAGAAAAVAVTGGVGLPIRLRFHNHAPQQLTRGLALHQQAADEFGGNLLAVGQKKFWGRCWESLVAMGVA
jgi:hypothetical protein